MNNLQDDILNWLSEYDDNMTSFIQYIVDKYNIPGKVFKTLLDISLDESFSENIRNNSALEIINLVDKHYFSIFQYWSNIPYESRHLLIDLSSIYKKVYGTLLFIEFNIKSSSSIKNSSDIRLYFDFIIYYDYIESTYEYDTINTFTTLCIEHISDQPLLFFISSFVYDKLISISDDTRLLALLRGFMNILVLDTNKRNYLYKILYKNVTSTSCKILNLLYHKYKDDGREFIKFYHPLLKSKDPEILREVVAFWDLAVTQFYANFIFKTFIANINPEVPEIYFLLEKIAENFNIAFDEKLLGLLKKDIKLMTHLYMYCKPLLLDVISNKIISSDNNIVSSNMIEDLILKLISKDFNTLLPYINDILKMCIKIDTKKLEILVLIMNILEKESNTGIPLESWNMYKKGCREQIEYCKKNIFLPDTNFSTKLRNIRLLASSNIILIDCHPLLIKFKQLEDEYNKFKVDAELSSYINKFSDRSLILEIRQSDTFISKRETEKYNWENE